MRSTTVLAVIAVLALGGAAASGYEAWQKAGELERTRSELASTASALEKAKAETRAARDEVSAARKDLAEQKSALDQMRSEVAAAAAFLEAEKAIQARLRQELSLANEKLALFTRRPQQTITDVRVIQPSIQAIKIAPGSGPTAIGRGMAAPVPAPAGR